MATPWKKFVYERTGEVLRAADKLTARGAPAAPHIAKRSFRLPETFHGIPTTHLGDDLTESEYGHLDEAVGRMAQMYPNSHALIDNLALINLREPTGNIRNPMGQLKVGKFFGQMQQEFAKLPISWGTAGLPLDKMAGAAMAKFDVNPNTNRIFLNPGLVRLGQDLPASILKDAARETTSYDAEGRIIPDYMGRIYTHEASHINQWTTLSRNLAADPYQRPPGMPFRLPTLGGPMVDQGFDSHVNNHLSQLLDNINTPIVAHLQGQQHGHGFGISGISESGLWNKGTEELLGSRYAASLPIELYPEANTARIHNSVEYQAHAEIINKGLSQAETHMEANQLLNRTTSSARHGARPQSRSAMGGIAYLQ